MSTKQSDLPTVAFDWAGTIARPYLIERAALLRLALLSRVPPRDKTPRKLHFHQSFRRDEPMNRALGIVRQKTRLENQAEVKSLNTRLFKLCYLAVLGQSVSRGSSHLALDKSFFQQLRRRGIRASLATTIPRDIIVPALRISRLSSYITAISAPDERLRPRSKVALLTRLAHKVRVLGYVGDRAEDFRASRRIRIPFCWVNWGHGTIPASYTVARARTSDDVLDFVDRLLDIRSSSW